MTSAAALAACGASATLAGLSSIVGPPSITATESSTDQALELIRKRREEASAFCPAGFTRSGGNCVPAGAAPTQVAAASPQVSTPPPAPVAVTTTTTTGPAPSSGAASSGAASSGAASRPASRPARPVASSDSQASSGASSGYSDGYGRSGSLKDGSYDMSMPGVVRMTGIWTEGYYDYEKHDNLAPNRNIPAFRANNNVDIPAQNINQSRRTSSGGFVSGVDISKFELGQSIRGYQIGLFGGYNVTTSRLSDITVFGQGFNGAPDNPDGLSITTVNADRQEVRGGFGGIYGTVVQGKFSADLAFKVDLFDVERSNVEKFFFDPNCNPADIVNTTTLNRDTTSMTNYTIATNANYRFDLNSSYYLEPTVGVRWTYSDFGGNAAALGLKDGDIFRVQGGMRLGTRFTTRDGWVWNNSITGLLYSDVSINGYSTGGTGPGGVAALDPRIDEGKLRVMGVLESRVDVGYGTTLYGVGEIRGGDDYIGYGLRGGVRYTW